MNRLLSCVIGIWLIIVAVSIITSESCAQEIRESDNNINLVCNNQPLRSVLDEIRVQAGIDIIYEDKLVDDLKVSCRIENGKVGNSLKNVLNDLDIGYKEFGTNTFVLFKKEKSEIKSYSTTIVEQQPVFHPDTNVVILEPVKISKSVPIYPPEAVKNKIEGKVTVKFFINTEGDVTKSLVEKTSGYEILDSAAVDYTTGLKFIPAKAKDKPTSIWFSLVFEYRINNEN